MTWMNIKPLLLLIMIMIMMKLLCFHYTFYGYEVTQYSTPEGRDSRCCKAHNVF